MAASLVRCYSCHKMRTRFCKYGNYDLCSRECAHALGDRRWCHDWRECGCTRYIKKRRMLREYMEYASAVGNFIDENDLGEMFEDYLDEEGIERIYPLYNVDSDDDPEEVLRGENAKLKEAVDSIDATQQTIALVTASLDRGAMARHLEQSRMFAEDCLSFMARQQQQQRGDDQ